MVNSKNKRITKAVTDEGINFKALEKELAQAVVDDKLYKLRNDAKIRAMENRVDYEQFEGLWKTAHLKSLTQKEIYTPDPLKAPWNAAVGAKAGISGEERFGRDSKEDEQSHSLMGTVEELPTTVLAFERDWRRLDSNENRFKLLKMIDSAVMEKLCSSDLSGAVLSKMFQVISEFLYDTCAGDELRRVVNILKWIRMGKRFSLTVIFLSQTDKVNLERIFSKLEKKWDEDEIQDLRDSYK